MKFKSFVLSFIFFIPFVLFGQKTTRFFIERNFGLDIDTNEFNFRYTGGSNTVYDTYSYEIKYSFDSLNALYIEPNEEFQYNQFYGECSDSLVYSQLQNHIERIKKDSSIYWVSDVREYNHNYYYFMKGGMKDLPLDTSITLWSMKCYNGELLLMVNCFEDSGSLLSVNQVEEVYINFLGRLTYYTNQEIKRVDSALFIGLETKIEIIDTISWEGNIWIDTEKEYEVLEVLFEVDRAHRVFNPKKGKKIEFEFYNKSIFRSGRIKPTGKGYFKLINPLGKIARLHFDFSKEFNH